MKKLKILYAEDEEVVARSITRMLSKICDIDYARDGLEGLNLFKEHKDYDMVVTDIRMPNMNGLDMLKGIKKEGFNPFTIIISAHNETEYLLEGIELRVNKFLIKPLNVDHLLDIILEYQKIASQKEEILKHKTSFENLLKIIDQNNIIITTDLEHNIKYINQKMLELSVYERDDILGEKLEFIKHPSESIEDINKIKDSLENKQPYRIVLQCLSKDDNPYWLRGIAAPFLDHNNEIKEHYYILEDATKEIIQRKELDEIKEKDALKDIQKAVKIQSQTLLDTIPMPAFVLKSDILVFENTIFDELFLLASQTKEEIIESLIDLNIQKDTPVDMLDFEQVDIGDQSFKIKFKILEDDEILIILIEV